MRPLLSDVAQAAYWLLQEALPEGAEPLVPWEELEPQAREMAMAYVQIVLEIAA